MAAIVCYLIIPKPGIALLAELLQVPAGNYHYGSFRYSDNRLRFHTGLACELVFAIFKYQSRSVMVAMLAGFVQLSRLSRSIISMVI